MKLVRIKIDNKNPAVVAYQEAFKRGYKKLSDKQKQLLEENAKKTNIQSKSLRDKVNAASSIQKLISRIIPGR